MAKRDYYEILGIARDADERAIKKAFREKSLQHHPDRNPGNKGAEEEFKLVAEAYDVLSNEDKRRLYDQFGHEGVSRAGFQGFQNVDDIFSQFSGLFRDFFGGDLFGFSGRGQEAGRGKNLQVDVEISFEDAARGVVREIKIPQWVSCDTCSGSGAAPGTSPETCPTCNGHREVTMRQGFIVVRTACPKCRGQGRIIKKLCPTCQGAGQKTVEQSLTVEFPPGIEDGETLPPVRGRGAPGRRGGPSGDLYVVARLAEHPAFVRDHADVHSELEISFTRAALGHRLSIPTLWGEREIEIPGGTQFGDTLTVRGAGFPHRNGRGQGNHVVHLRVSIPEKLSEEQASLLRRLAELEEGQLVNGEVAEEGGKGRRKKKGIFQRLKEAVE